MNDDDLLQYMIQMGAMKPEQEAMSRKQAYVDALRSQSMQPLQGGMAGRVYVPPSLAQGAAQLGQAFFANRGQRGVDDQAAKLNLAQRQALYRMGDNRRMKKELGNVDTSKFYNPDEDDILKGYTLPKF